MLWKEDSSDYSVTYPIKEILRRANLKFKIHDRSIPMMSDTWGMFPQLAHRLLKFKRWKKDGIRQVKVLYDPGYFIRNRGTVHLIDPLHTYNVVDYLGIK